MEDSPPKCGESLGSVFTTLIQKGFQAWGKGGELPIGGSPISPITVSSVLFLLLGECHESTDACLHHIR